MKKIFAILVAALLVGGAAAAQEKTEKKKKGSAVESVSKFFRKMKDGFVSTADAILSKDEAKLKLIDGTYYMPLCGGDQYSAADGDGYRKMCRKQFVAKYPDVQIVSCAIPQDDWDRQTIEEDGKVTGYVNTLNCYILAKDGSDGYINAKFVFVRTKEVGKAYQNDKANWGRWVRTDIMNNEVYAELLKKSK